VSVSRADVQINNVGANDFTGGITWVEVPLGQGTKPLLDADTSTRCVAMHALLAMP
jgi:hypothetical protein